MDADEVIARLGLAPHPEGGHYAETYRHRPQDGGRGACTAITYLLRAGERSHWHRVDAVEIWHHYAGGPLALSVWEEGGTLRRIVLGSDLSAGQMPQAVVPERAWQAAEPLGEWTLAGCTVSPAFEFAGFTLAPPGWRPPVTGDRP
jgi:predicted cupin superfamily sugar epimerase